MIWFVLVGCATPPGCWEEVTPTVSAEPGAGGNVLVVLFDDVGVDQLSAYGATGEIAKTPTLDCVCDRGVRFERAWGSPVCSPGRAAVLTGRSAVQHGVGLNVRKQAQLPREEVTLGEVGRAAHRATGFFGKWHLDAWNSPGALLGPRLQGFETFTGTLGNLIDPAAPDPPKDDTFSGFETSWQVVDGAPEWRKGYATSLQVDDALKFIAHEKGPWLVVLSMYASHDPFHDPPAELLNTPLSVVPTPAQRYRAALEAADTELGRLFRQMDPGVLADTTVIVTADNGSPDVAASLADQSRAKATLFEGGIHVPLVVMGPAVQAPGVSEALVTLEDILPTVVTQLGPDAEAAVDGVSLNGKGFWQQLADPEAPGATTVSVAWTPFGGALEQAVRDDRFKLVTHNDGTPSLFDLGSAEREDVDLLLQPAETLDAAARDALQRLTSRLLD